LAGNGVLQEGTTSLLQKRRASLLRVDGGEELGEPGIGTQ
jgi:hypothetical protein